MDELQKIIDNLVETYKQLVINTNHYASGELVDTVKGRYTVNGGLYEISIDVASYWKYLEYGRGPGKMPPIDNIERWITVKSIVPTAINGKVPTTKQLAYLISRSIGEKGTKPHNLLQKAVDANVNSIIDAISERFNREIKEITTLPDYV